MQRCTHCNHAMPYGAEPLCPKCRKAYYAGDQAVVLPPSTTATVTHVSPPDPHAVADAADALQAQREAELAAEQAHAQAARREARADARARHPR